MVDQNGRRDFSIRQLLAVGGGAALLPAVLLGAYATFDLVSRDHNAQRERLIQTARSLTTSVDHEIEALARKAVLLAGSRLARSGNLTAFGELLRDAFEATGHSFFVIDRANKPYLSFGNGSDGKFEQIRLSKSAARAFDSARPTVTKMISSRGGTSAPVVLAPIRVGVEAPYVLALVPEPGHFARVLKDVPMPKGWVAAIDDPDNRIIARSEMAERFVGSQARLRTPHGGSDIAEFTDLEGRPSVMAYHVSPHTNFRAVVWAPESVFYQSTTALTAWLTGLAALTMLLTMAAAYLLGALLSAPIQQIASTAHLLGSGQNVVHRRTIMREVNLAEAAMEQASMTIATRQRELLTETERSRFLTRELAHRVKNLLAVVSAIARQTSRSQSSTQGFAEQFQVRLGGLSRSVDLLVQSDWKGAALRDLLHKQLEPFGAADRFKVRGPDLRLTPSATEHLGLAFHELATNAAKHGAWLSETGQVEITFSLEGDVFTMTWNENGGPPVDEPTTSGFGRTVTENVIGQALNGSATVSYNRSGLKWVLRAPASVVVEQSDRTTV